MQVSTFRLSLSKCWDYAKSSFQFESLSKWIIFQVLYHEDLEIITKVADSH